ncbi:3-oxoadipate enol-lactone hydrolase/4-carboxymuconolactone decarboxylase [Haloferax prahovense DSM 18310]|uniref:3-oxoadipate enol-lactone hydrolase/4-carboxymuconolactone decarboxylase n=1 Tax=Haloferax prahovense (strain DSM 18310 / JCM 13924 / TL6) TaxID=1227461 RepID=M0GNU8_HALPT|nr:alpha/beta hydrolase [Haloferax prahovense]ELZ73906.1 3-oxoadipate enol-lactone hydrolase/4-carboxymuconolactone decarboxylase [Haloferax prahovense DSM 18310]
MPTAVADGVELYYDSEGDGETVAFVGDAGYGAWQWGWQHAAVAGPYESLVTDLRGAGRSDAPAGPYSVETLVSDLVAVLADANVRKAHLVGFGLGGLVALEAARTTNRVRSLVLVGTAASGDGIDPEPLSAAPDVPAALRESLAPALSEEFRAEQPDVVDQLVSWREREDADPEAWAAQAAAVADYDAGPLYEVTVPTLVLHGDDDPVWPVEGGRALAEGLPRGEFESFAGARHLVTVERSRLVNDALVSFLESLDDD